MTLKQKYEYLIGYFSEHRPDAASELEFRNSFELIVAVVLSAQCTDKRVNIVTKGLFAQYPTPEAMAAASVEEIHELIKSVSYPNNKAKHLSGLAKMLVSEFGGEVPSTMEELTRLPGVGRKTANVILSIVYDQPAMAVDTHVFRVAHRLGIVHNANTPLEVEKQLTAHFPPERIPIAHHWLILHGRYVCTARNPKCEKCGISAVCDFSKNHTKP
ncbi:MAG: endonuclease III [Bacteroidales bacterium]|nr:endonuclease III [Bacteroidales bacterium]